MSVLALLREREQTIAANDDNREMSKKLKYLLSPRYVHLGSVLDTKSELLRGHILMGFSYDGSYLISYQLQMEGDVISETHFTYSLHWWQLDLGKPLLLVKSTSLFEGASINDYLELLVCQRERSQCIIVLGSEGSCTEGLDQRNSFVSILSSPPSVEDVSIHLRYELLSPFPQFNPSLSLQLPDAILINTGCSLVVIDYSSHSVQTPSQPNSIGCYIVNQSFLTNDRGPPHPINSLSISPCQILPVEVYKEQKVLIEVSPVIDKYRESVDVCQYSLDIEQWLVSELGGVFAKMDVSLSSLADYDMELIEVHEIEEKVTVNVKVKVETTSNNNEVYSGYSIVLLCEWYVKVNRAVLITYSEPIALSLQEIHHMTGSACCHGDKSPIISPPYCCHVHVLSNENVLLSGKSLSTLHHHSLPLSIILTRPHKN